MEKISFAVNFGGFYYSIHDEQCERAVAYEIDIVDENGEIDDTEEKLYYYSGWQTVHEKYAKKYLDLLEYELGIGLEFEELVSPKFYNFSTDVIYAKISIKDVLKVFAYIKENGLKKDVYAIIKDRTTLCDGFCAFYNYEDMFKKEHRNLLIQHLFDAIINDKNNDYPLFVEEFYI